MKRGGNLKSKSAVRGDKHRILLVDDHAILRNGLAALINQEADMVICGEAGEAPKAFALVAKTKPHAAVVDISLRNGNGLELIKDIRTRYPHLPMLVLSMHDEALYAERALRAGALGYVMKEEAMEKLLAGIRCVLAGEMFISDSVKSRFLSQLVGGGTTRGYSSIDSLSDRQLEVFRLIGEGQSTKQIAVTLRLSIRTIEGHREFIKDKLNLGNGTALVQEAFQHMQSGSGA